MNQQWAALKTILGAKEIRDNLFLSLIDEQGNILSANARMLKTLHLDHPRETAINFFHLLHPGHIDLFKNVLLNSREGNQSYSAELYLKNGYYHPMKWEVNSMGNANGTSTFFCIGYTLMDDERLERFNRLGEKNYQLIMESLNIGILFHDKDAELIAVNQKAAEIYHSNLETLYKSKDIRGMWSSRVVTNEAGQRISFEDLPFSRALRDGKTQSETLKIRFSNGKERWIHFNSQPLFDPGAQEPFSVVSSIMDVTQEKKLSIEVKERKMMLHAFLDESPNLGWVVNEDGQLVFASRSFCRYFRVEAEQVVNKHILEALPLAAFQSLYEKHDQVLKTGQPVEFIEKAKWADGTDFIFHVNIFPIEGFHGRKRVGGNAVNLSEKYAVEKQLREANDRLLLLSRATSDAIWEWDMQTGYVFRNDALMDMVGYHVEATKGLSWWLRRIHPEDRNRVTDKIKEATDKGQHSWEDRYHFKCADGTYKYIQDRGFVVYENGLPVKMIGSLQDITDLKELENQLMEEKLERQKEISETVIRAQEKERTRLGHELHDNVNQILSTTKLFVDLLTPSSKEEKEIKTKSIEYILMAIEEIRKLSRDLVAPQLKGDGLVDSIRTLVDDIHLSNVVRIKFTHDNENDLLSPGKKVTLFRIVQEQLKNIIRHSQATQVDIFLQCKDARTQLVIKDNGCGFDPTQTARGIGLSNIYDRTRFYNGTVDIQTSTGNGCTLSIIIPGIH